MFYKAEKNVMKKKKLQKLQKKKILPQNKQTEDRHQQQRPRQHVIFDVPYLRIFVAQLYSCGIKRRTKQRTFSVRYSQVSIPIRWEYNFSKSLAVCVHILFSGK